MNVIRAKYLKDYVLHVGFDDGTEGKADLRAYLKGPKPLAELQDKALFRRVRVEDGTVSWPNGADLAVELVYALAHDLTPPKTYEDALRNELEVSLRELRTMSDVRQEDLAEELDVTQGAVSRLEANVADAKLATLRRYAKALGWDLEVVAVKGAKRMRLRGV